jgi:hypothetical protein
VASTLYGCAGTLNKYMTSDKQKFEKYSCESRKIVCDQLKKKRFQQKALFTNETKQEEACRNSMVLKNCPP